MSTKPAKRAAIYCRISKDAEGRSLGVERQEHECRALAERLGVDVSRVYVDNDISAYSGKVRPDFQTMREAIEHGGVQTVIAWHPDRLTRSTRELEDLIDLLDRHRVEVRTVQGGEYDLSTATGRMSARIVGSVARHASEQTSERLKSKFADLARRGAPPGGRAPYGFAKGYTAHEPDEARWLRWMADRVVDGWSLLAIARELDRLGVPTKQGRAWHHSTVRSVLVNPAVAGRRVHQGEDVGEAAWEPIIDRGTWLKVRAALMDESRKHAKSGQYLLSGLVRSAGGDRMNGKPQEGRRVYSTRSPATLAAQIDADRLEELVVAVVFAALRDRPLPTAEQPDSDALAELEAVEAEMNAVADAVGAGQITAAQMLLANDGLMRRRDAILKRQPVRRPEALLGQPGEVIARWDDLTVAQQRRIIATFVASVVVSPVPAGQSVKVWHPERVQIIRAGTTN